MNWTSCTDVDDENEKVKIFIFSQCLNVLKDLQALFDQFYPGSSNEKCCHRVLLFNEHKCTTWTEECKSL